MSSTRCGIRCDMARNEPMIRIRLPESLKARLEAAHAEHGRSMNAEIRMRLEFSFESGFSGELTDKMLAAEVESIRDEMRGGRSNTDGEIKDLKRRLALLESKVYSPD